MPHVHRSMQPESGERFVFAGDARQTVHITAKAAPVLKQRLTGGAKRDKGQGGFADEVFQLQTRSLRRDPRLFRAHPYSLRIVHGLSRRCRCGGAPFRRHVLVARPGSACGRH
ncbi:hypothetical protein EMEDMD4_170018 [Sinorhizobium medicae]|uniref:Uncharacterized protein n=1 Tax=Sinorhizobium medicae TaxID=110321 RepID=A0A508WTH5_9HYPH|nr:hypothetical protein EMEDMD4_170018 [Sinorhizobium medicae]